MKQVTKKIIVILLIALISMNAVFPNFIYATELDGLYEELTADLDRVINDALAERIARKEFERRDLSKFNSRRKGKIR